MMNGWKIKLCLGDCDLLWEKSVLEEDIPFLPHVGDGFWLSDKAQEELEKLAIECWEEHKCEDCPYSYGRQESVDDVSVADYIVVESMLHKVDKKEVLITLCDGTKKEDRQ